MIRRYKPADMARLREITIDAFNGVSIDQNIGEGFGRLNGTDWGERKAARVAENPRENPDGVFVAVEAGEVVGYITCELDRHERSGHIINLGVDSRFRGRGLGRALMERAEAYFREAGMRYARIETLEQNTFCMAFYPHMGFGEVARNVHFFKELT